MPPCFLWLWLLGETEHGRRGDSRTTTRRRGIDMTNVQQETRRELGGLPFLGVLTFYYTRVY